MNSSDNDIKQPLNKNFREPKIRFPDFESSWTQKRLQDISTRINCRNVSMETNLVLTISAQYGLIDQTKFFNKSISTNGLDKYYLLHQGDFAYNRSYSKDYSYGAIKRLDNYPEGLVSTLYIAFRPKQSIDSDYLSYYFETDKWNLEIAGVSGEGARNHGLLNISPIDFFNTKHWLPESLQEQQKIGMFFNYLFQLSATISEKVDALKKYKQGLIKNEFSGTIMSWKYHNSLGVPLAHFLEEVNETAEKNGSYPHLTLSKDGIQEKTERYDRDFLVSTENKKYKITRLNQLCYNPANLKFGVICLNKYGDGIFSPIYVTFKIKNINPIYLESLLTSQNFINYSLKFQEGTVYERMAVSVEDFTKIKIMPSDSDHQNIFSCVIEHIDSLIQIYTAKIAKLDDMRNYLLASMFI